MAKKVIKAADKRQMMKGREDDYMFESYLDDFIDEINHGKNDEACFVCYNQYSSKFSERTDAFYAIILHLAKSVAETQRLRTVAKHVADIIGVGFDAIIRCFRSMEYTEQYKGRVVVEDNFGLDHIRITY